MADETTKKKVLKLAGALGRSIAKAKGQTVDETNVLKILEDERKQREADKLNDAIRERIAALTDLELSLLSEKLADLWIPNLFDAPAARRTLVALLAPEAPNG